MTQTNLEFRIETFKRELERNVKNEDYNKAIISRDKITELESKLVRLKAGEQVTWG